MSCCWQQQVGPMVCLLHSRFALDTPCRCQRQVMAQCGLWGHGTSSNTHAMLQQTQLHSPTGIRDHYWPAYPVSHHGA